MPHLAAPCFSYCSLCQSWNYNLTIKQQITVNRERVSKDACRTSGMQRTLVHCTFLLRQQGCTGGSCSPLVASPSLLACHQKVCMFRREQIMLKFHFQCAVAATYKLIYTSFIMKEICLCNQLVEQCWAGLHSWLSSVVFLAWPYSEATLQPGTACIVCLEVSACKQQAVLK